MTIEQIENYLEAVSYETNFSFTVEKEDVVDLVHNEEYKEKALEEFSDKLRALF